jgi:serine protease
MITLIFSLLISISGAKPIKIAVIDSGIDKSQASVKLCADGHKDFTGEGLHDVRGHGTIVSKLIDDVAKDEDYCQVIIKYSAVNENNNAANLIEALKYVVTLDVTQVNISAGGIGKNKPEKDAILKILNKGMTIVAAAGNEGQNLDVDCNYFPACYDSRIIVVGALDESGKRYSGSNYGKVVDFYFSGVNIRLGNQIYSGTSMATASVSGSLIVVKKKFREIQQHKKRKL